MAKRSQRTRTAAISKKPPVKAEASPRPHLASPARPWLPLTFLLLAAIAAVVYVNTLGNEFAFDDFHVIPSDPTLLDVRSFLPTTWRGPRSPGERPLRTASYALDYALFGGDPFRYHLSNLLY